MALAALPAAAQAQSITATLSPASIQAGQSTTLTFSVSYTNTGRNPVNLHEVTFQLPSGFTLSGGSASGWSAPTVDGRSITFEAPCTSTGIAPGKQASFQVTATATAADDQNNNTQVSARSRYRNTTACETGAIIYYTSVTVRTPVKVLSITGTASPANLLGPGLGSGITWTVKNGSTKNQTLTLTRTPGGSSGTGWTGKTCSNSLGTIAAGKSGSVTCSYTFSATGTYSFSASARSSSGSTTATVPVAIQVGTVGARWNNPAVVIGHPGPLTVTNDSLATVTRVEVRNAFSGGLKIARAIATCTAGSLAFDAVNSTAANAIFTGSLPAGASASLAITYDRSSLKTPSSTTFTVSLTPSEGASWAYSIAIASTPLVLPLPDVTGLSILSSWNASSQQQNRLDWTNVSGNGATHDGVVIFRSDSPGTLPYPQDFKQYTIGSDGVVFADKGNGTATDQSWSEVASGARYYRVCNHDTRFVYSDCNWDFWKGEGWLDSALPPTGGWTRQMGSTALDLIGIITGSTSAVPSNEAAPGRGGSLTLIDRKTGLRVAAPVQLDGMPGANTAGVKLYNDSQNRTFAFAADDEGHVTAVDAVTGQQVWSITVLKADGKTPESFTSGLNGLSYSSLAADMQSVYSTDILLLASSNSGDLIALNAATHAELWRVNTHGSGFALPTYDREKNLLFVPTSVGVIAYALKDSRPGTAPVVAWQSAAAVYTVSCVKTTAAEKIACVDRTGRLHVFDRSSGSEITVNSTVSAPASLNRMSAGTPGFLVGSANRLVRVTADAALTSLEVKYAYDSPATTLSPVMGFSANGYVIAAGSDYCLHKWGSETLDVRDPSCVIPGGSVDLGPLSYDATNKLFLFGSSSGRIWAVPLF